MTRILRPSRRDLLLGGAAALAAGTAFVRMPRRKEMSIRDGQLERVVPQHIGGWTADTASGVVLPPPDQLAQLLYNQQVTRTYVAGDRLPVMLLMAYGSSETGMLQIHRPEICYPASGFALTRTTETVIPLGNGRGVPARRFTARSDTRVEHVLYWTRIGDMLPVNWTAQRIAVMRSNLAGFVPDGLLVRLSTIADDEDQAEDALQRFARTMLAAIGPGGRRMLIGSIGI